MSKALQSKAFPNAYLRIDGTGVSAPSSDGGGTVNCQAGVADFETFEEIPQPDGTIAFASVAFPDVYIRMDGRGIGSAIDGGAGSVNCAFGVGAWEKFHKHPQSDGTVAFESAAFRGVYLRLDAQDVVRPALERAARQPPQLLHLLVKTQIGATRRSSSTTTGRNRRRTSSGLNQRAHQVSRRKDHRRLRRPADPGITRATWRDTKWAPAASTASSPPDVRPAPSPART